MASKFNISLHKRAHMQFSAHNSASDSLTGLISIGQGTAVNESLRERGRLVIYKYVTKFERCYRNSMYTKQNKEDTIYSPISSIIYQSSPPPLL